MRRRTFSTFLSSTAAASAVWPSLVRAQQAAMPVAGFLFSQGKDTSTFRAEAFRQGLKEAGYVDGENVVVEYRWGDGHDERLPALAAELIARKVVVICAGNINSALAAKAVAGTTPIVFLTAGDPVGDGLVASFSKPGGNATGVMLFSAGLVAKRLQFLHELVPTADVVGFLMNPANPTAPTQVKAAQAAAGAIGIGIQVVEASNERQLDGAFEALSQRKVLALAVGADPYFSARSEQVIALAARYRLPAAYEWRESAVAGGLVAYGTVLADAFRNLGVYTGRILGGARPADLPVLQQTKFELVINLKTANALGLKIPALLLAQADEVIE